jgi:hypothetical protein
MRSFYRFLEDQGFQADACKDLEHPDFYALAEAMHRALEQINELEPIKQRMSPERYFRTVDQIAYKALNPPKKRNPS